jgi:3-hydroxyisobutyrate dehydrogenase-like beta-hydroxyacid dehydrogenase
MDQVSGDQAIGIIGTGRMGAGMWRRLQSQGHTATVYDVSPAATDALAALGAPVAADPADLAGRADLVVLSLPRSSDVESVVDGPRGLAAGVRPGTIVLDTTSGEPSVSARLAATLAEGGAEYLDAGVSGGVAGADAGTLKIMAGGDAATFERARPVLDLLGTRVWHCGPAGTGHAMKTVLNLAAQTKLMAEIESLALGVKAGLDAHQVAEVLELGVWQHFLLGPDGRIPFQFVLALVGKDFDVAMRLAAERGVPVPVTGAAVQAMRTVRAEVGGDADLMEFVGVVERWNNVRLDGATTPHEQGGDRP